jgi:hypothetical protein
LTMVMEASMVILFVILLWGEGTSDRRNKKWSGF